MMEKAPALPGAFVFKNQIRAGKFAELATSPQSLL